MDCDEWNFDKIIKKLNYKEDEEEENCYVCYEKTKIKIVPCNHPLCKDCLMKLTSLQGNNEYNEEMVTSCPYCRTNIGEYELIEK